MLHEIVKIIGYIMLVVIYLAIIGWLGLLMLKLMGQVDEEGKEEDDELR